MKYFKKKGFWVFYVAIVLAGSFIIMALSLQNQSPVIPDVNAQMYWDFYNTPYGTPQVSQTQFGTGFESPGTLSQGAAGFAQYQSFGVYQPKKEPWCYCIMATCMTMCTSNGDTSMFCDRRTMNTCSLMCTESMRTFSTCSLMCNIDDALTMSTCPPMCIDGGNTWMLCRRTMSTCPPMCFDGGDTWMLCWLLPSPVPTPGEQTYGSVLCTGGQTYGSLLCTSGQTYGGLLLCGGGQTYRGLCGDYLRTLNLTQSPPY